MKKKINLALSGSGTLFYYHVGALKRVLESYEIQSIVGTSGGSIIASLFASGYSINEIEQIVKTINLSECYDWNINFFNKFGFLEGERILKQLSIYLNKKFSDIKIPLVISTTNYTNKQVEYFSTSDKKYSDIKLYEAVRCSLSIPFLFKYYELKNNIYIDGGIINNFPVDFFNENTIGVKIESDWKNTDSKISSKVFSWLFDKIGINYFLDIISLMMSATEKKHIEDAIYSNIIVIKSNKNGTNFSYKITDINDMIFQGYNITDKYLKELI